jgi:hypothetical protein
MKNYINPSYTFTPGASGVGTVDTNIANFDIKFLVGIINITRETVIYWPSLTGRGYTNVAGDVITLEYSTVGHNSGDLLQFVYDSTEDYPVFSRDTITNTAVGAPADSAASSDTGTFGIIAFIKRAMQNWTTLLGRVPASVGGRVPVDGSGVTQPVSGSVSVSNFPATQPVSGPLTSAELASSEVVEALRQIQMEVEVLKNSIGQSRVDSGGRLRILLDSISASLTLATVTTVGTVTNQVQIGGVSAIDQVPSLRRQAADSLLTKINIT